MNDYLILKVTSYLKKCYNCSKLNLEENNNTCDFCKKFYCSNCKDLLRTFYGFKTNNYCHDCGEYLYMELNF